MVEHFHLFVEPAFFRKVAYVHHVFLGHRLAVEQHFARVGARDLVEDTYERCLPGAVGAEQSIYTPLLDVEVHMVKSAVSRIVLDHIVNSDNVHFWYLYCGNVDLEPFCLSFGGELEASPVVASGMS